MAREYGRVYSAFWQSPEVRAMSEDGRTLALYLLTSPHANLIGCFRLPIAYAADDLQWPSLRVSEAFGELSSKAFISVDEASRWIVIHKYLKWNAFESPNVAVAAQKAFDQVPVPSLKSLLAKALLEFGVHMKEPFVKALEALAKPFVNPEPEPEPIQNQNQNLTGTGKVCDQPSAGAPKNAKAQESKKTGPVWASYSQAYMSRYGVEPVRNAKVNGQLGQFVDRIGADEAPSVAAFFVGSQNAFYVRQMHPVDSLLKDAEKLRTEWATGRRVTTTSAQMADRTQTNANAFAGLIKKAKELEAANGER